MDDYHFDGDPATDSTRRQLQRLMEGRQSRRWPWVVAALAGSAAFAFWRMRSRRSEPPEAAADAAPTSATQHAR